MEVWRWALVTFASTFGKSTRWRWRKKSYSDWAHIKNNSGKNASAEIDAFLTMQRPMVLWSIKSALQAQILASQLGIPNPKGPGETGAGQGTPSAEAEIHFLGGWTTSHQPHSVLSPESGRRPPPSPGSGSCPRGWVGWSSRLLPVTRVPTRSSGTSCSNYPESPASAGAASRRVPGLPPAGMPPPRSPARVVSVRSWLAAPRGNSLSFRPLRLSTPVTAASSSARSRERLHEPGPGPAPEPELGPQLTPERLPPDATGPEYSAAAVTATKPAAAISQPTTLRPAGSAHARPELMGGRGKGHSDPGRFPWWAGLRCPSAHPDACLRPHRVFQGKLKQNSQIGCSPLL